MTLQEKLETYFNTILNFNWRNFNTLDTQKQSNEWHSLLDEFDRIIREEHKLNDIDFEAIHDCINLYHDRFNALPIESSLYTVINKFFISGRFHSFVKNLAFESAQKVSTVSCDCELLHKFSKDPETTNLKEIKILHDGYYNPMLLECTTCNFQWISYVSDDSIGNTVFKKYIEEK